MDEIRSNQGRPSGFKLFGTTIPLKINKVKEEEEAINEGETSTKRPDKTVPCPRCKSMETKFCYFNNYNVNQPRHFCKGCQRYWTAGGTLRNVPVGAGRRKTKPSCQRVNGSLGECMFDASGVMEFGFERVVEQWNVNDPRDDFRHVLQAKRQCTGPAGQIC